MLILFEQLVSFTHSLKNDLYYNVVGKEKFEKFILFKNYALYENVVVSSKFVKSENKAKATASYQFIRDVRRYFRNNELPVIFIMKSCMPLSRYSAHCFLGIIKKTGDTFEIIQYDSMDDENFLARRLTCKIAESLNLAAFEIWNGSQKLEEADCFARTYNVAAELIDGTFVEPELTYTYLVRKHKFL